MTDFLLRRTNVPLDSFAAVHNMEFITGRGSEIAAPGRAEGPAPSNAKESTMFDPKMFDPKTMFGFDADKVAEMFKAPDMTKFFEQAKMPAVDMDVVIAAQQKNMQALMEANRAAAAGYQDLYKRQVAIFEETMASVKDQMADAQSQAATAEGAQKNAELVKAGFDKALGNMKELAELAQKANMEAFEIVQARVKESLAELKAISEKATA